MGISKNRWSLFVTENMIESDLNKKSFKINRPNLKMGEFITSGARLILAITEKILMDHGENYTFCDTDSVGVPVDRMKDIQEYFRKLNPYSFDADIFEMEKENFNDKGEIEALWFYWISAKRYVLYSYGDGLLVIRKHSSHALGHLLNPFSRSITTSKWDHKIWEDILSIIYEIEDLGMVCRHSSEGRT